MIDLKPDEIAIGLISRVTFRTIKVLCGNFGRSKFRANVTSTSAYKTGERFLLLLQEDGSKVTVHQWRHVRDIDEISSKTSCSEAMERLRGASR